MIRELLPNDYDEVLKLDYQIHEIHLKNRPDIYNDENPLPYGYFNRIINSGYNYVYEINGKIVGLIIGVINESIDIPIYKKRKVLFIDDLVVDKNYRHQEIGTKLYLTVKKKALENHLDGIELNVWSFNKDALKFYEKIGLKMKNIIMEDLF